VVLALGAEQVVWGVDMRPGHPLFLARHRDQVVLGLPGNPVSSMVCFHVFGREIMGVAAAGVRRAPMAAPYAATTERTELIRCRWGEDGLAPVERQGSHAIGDLAGADALAVVPAGLGGLQAGEMARFIALD
jgi:molybdopterin molybdotransferase